MENISYIRLTISFCIAIIKMTINYLADNVIIKKKISLKNEIKKYTAEDLHIKIIFKN